MYQYPDEYLEILPERGSYAVANADGARLEPFQCLYDNKNLPEKLRESMMKRVQQINKK